MIGNNQTLPGPRACRARVLTRRTAPFVAFFVCALAIDLQAALPAGSVFDVRGQGALGDGASNDAVAIQKAIDACHEAGGGIVWFPAGNYLSGTLVLKSNVTVSLSPGATLWGSKRIEDFEPHHLIYARDAENIAIEGGESKAGGLDVPENAAHYPEATMFGALPAYGLYGRHVESLTVRSFDTRWEETDVRPAMIFDDVKDLHLDGVRAGNPSGDAPVLWLHQVDGALVRGCRASVESERFLRITGDVQRPPRVFGNDWGDGAGPDESVSQSKPPPRSE